MRYVNLLRSRPIAIETKKANKQHYEVGTGVLSEMLGPRMKYSACLYPTGKETLEEAEVKMMDLYVARARLGDGMKVLDLGYASCLVNAGGAGKLMMRAGADGVQRPST
jgi:cyclopropane fatty-acyl-phospholipid synthase-like methyltransferase